jgi:hypothetical protein
MINSQSEIYMAGRQQIAGTKFGNIHYYYDLIKVTVMGNTRGMKILLGIPLRSPLTEMRTRSISWG